MIRAEDLCLTLDGRVILDHVSFTIARGESVALVGPNGSGKTSILRCLLGLVPFQGRVSVDGHDVVREPIAARSRIGYVPQKVAFGDARAAEVLAFVTKLRRLDPSRIRDALRHVGLAEHARERVRTFSGGMQQRLSLAVALLADAPVLLFDEPSASLDREGQDTFFDIVGQLRRRRHTLLLASHRAEEVDSLTDRVLRLDRGRLMPSATRTANAECGLRVVDSRPRHSAVRNPQAESPQSTVRIPQSWRGRR
jgi:ABC-type multidrug transport system ATPase subunit